MSGATTLIVGSGAAGGSALSAVVSPTFVSGYRNGKGTAQTGSYCLCTASGGSPPYTYLWTYVSGDTEIYVNSSTTTSTLFSAFFSDPGTSFSAIWKCVVTDSTPTAIDSTTVSIELSRGT